jgi:glycosyltransferase involved in cell wall biosynthesis
MLEAMAVETLVIGSDTPPVREILNHDNSVIVPFFDAAAVADAAIAALRDPASHSARRQKARQAILAGYDVRTCAQAFIRCIRDI